MFSKTRKNINQEILKLAIPNILSNISVPLLSSVDTALMGFEASASYLGAVGLGAMIFNFLYWGFGFLRMGTTGMTAQAFGRQNDTDITGTMGRGMLVAILLALLFILFQIPIKNASLWLLAADMETAPLISEYFNIRIWAAPAALGLMVLMGWLFGMQNAIYPLILTLIINITNIILSVLFVKKYGWGLSGVAWGTVIAQYIGFIFGCFLLMFKYGHYIRQLSFNLILQWEKLKSFFLINRDIFIRTLCLIGTFGFFFNRSSVMGVTILAINQVFMQYINWMSYAVDGFAYASESLVGKYQGSQDEEKKEQSISLSFVWGGALALLFSLGFWLGGQKLLMIFTDDADVLSTGPDYLIWICIYPILAFASYIWDGIFVGLTAGRAMRDTMILSLLAFIGSYYFLQEFGNHGIWAAMLVYVTARGVLQWFWYRFRMGN